MSSLGLQESRNSDDEYTIHHDNTHTYIGVDPIEYC